MELGGQDHVAVGVYGAHDDAAGPVRHHVLCGCRTRGQGGRVPGPGENEPQRRLGPGAGRKLGLARGVVADKPQKLDPGFAVTDVDRPAQLFEGLQGRIGGLVVVEPGPQPDGRVLQG